MSRRKFKLEHPPIIIGDHAMELHKIPLTNSSATSVESHSQSAADQSPMQAPLYLMISQQDYDAAKEYYTNTESITPWAKSICDEKGIHYFANWYSFTYDALIQTAVKIKSKLVVDKQSMLVMVSLPAFDKKNKISRAVTKKYLQDAVCVANSYIA